MSNPKNHKSQELSAASLHIRSLVFYCVLSLVVFSSAWYWLNAQLETILERRVSDLGLATAEVAAKASSEALVSEDKLFMQKLVDDLANGEFIESAAIYRLDGTLLAKTILDKTTLEKNALAASTLEKAVVANTDKISRSSQTPSEPTNTTDATLPPEDKLTKSSDSDEFNQPEQLSDTLTAYIPKFKSVQVPYLVDIIWQDSHVGWIEVTLNRQKLERDLRAQSYQITITFIVILCSILAIGLALIIRSMILHRRRKKRLSEIEAANKTASPINLDDVVQQVKSGNFNRDLLHFLTPNLSELPDEQNEAMSHTGLFALIVVQKIGNESAIIETQLRQVLQWQKVIMESATMYQLPCLTLNRQQYLLPIQSEQVDNLHKCMMLLQQIENNLSVSSRTHCRVSMVVSEGSILINKANEKVGLVSGEDFDIAAKRLRANRSFAVVMPSLTEQLEWTEPSPSNQTPLDAIDPPTENTGASKESLSLAERQAANLMDKYWSDLDDQSTDGEQS